MKRKFKAITDYRYGEVEVIEEESNKKYTLTQRHKLLEEDFYSIYRYIACENVDIDQIPEKDFYVYQISYMESGYGLTVVFVDQEVIHHMFKQNLIEFLHGNALDKITVALKGI